MIIFHVTSRSNYFSRVERRIVPTQAILKEFNNKTDSVDQKLSGNQF